MSLFCVGLGVEAVDTVAVLCADFASCEAVTVELETSGLLAIAADFLLRGGRLVVFLIEALFGAAFLLRVAVMFREGLRVLSGSRFLGGAHERIGVDLGGLFPGTGGSHGVVPGFGSVMFLFLVILGLFSVSGKRVVDWHWDSQSLLGLRGEALSELGGGLHVVVDVSVLVGVVAGLFGVSKD